jgi:hypothetical protein
MKEKASEKPCFMVFLIREKPTDDDYLSPTHHISRVQASVHRKTFEQEKCNHDSEKTVRVLPAIPGLAPKNGVILIITFQLGIGMVQLCGW